MQILNNLQKTRILVVGDVMLDRYWWGSVGRISPEAPVPVVRLVKTTLAAGGAANVAANVAGLGARAVLIGIIGTDGEGRLIRDELDRAGIDHSHLVEIEHRPTTVKTRVIAHSQQVARVDQETDLPLDSDSERNVIEKIRDLLPDCDGVVVSDYAKGLLTDSVLSDLIKSAATIGTGVFVDPKGKEYEKYRGATMITPNRREAAEACNLGETQEGLVARAGAKLIGDLDMSAVLITQGEEGMTLFRRDQTPKHFAAAARKVYDVTGAGDTVIATLAATIGAGADLEAATSLANIAAGLVVEQVGTTSVSIAELRHAIESDRT